MCEEQDIKQRWNTYFETLLNVENPRQIVEYGQPSDIDVEDIGVQQVKEAIRGMKNGKATGPDEIPVEATWESRLCMRSFAKHLIAKHCQINGEKGPWYQFTKRKGTDIQDCENY